MLAVFVVFAQAASVALAPSPAPDARVEWASPDGVSGTVTTLNAELLLTAEAPAPSGEEVPEAVPVPVLTSVVIGVCVTFTVLFGIVPAPLLDFCNHATLLFLSH